MASSDDDDEPSEYERSALFQTDDRSKIKALHKVANFLFLPIKNTVAKKPLTFKGAARGVVAVNRFDVEKSIVKIEDFFKIFEQEIEKIEPCDLNDRLPNIITLIEDIKRKANTCNTKEKEKVDNFEKKVKEKSRIIFYVKNKPNENNKSDENISDKVQGFLETRSYLQILKGEDNSPAFEAIKDNISKSLEGKDNTVVIAYGPTGSGKTYTLHGSRDMKTEGMMAKIIEQIFDLSSREVRCRFLEFKMKKFPQGHGYEYSECYRDIGGDTVEEYTNMKGVMADAWNQNNPITKLWQNDERIKKDDFIRKYKNALANREKQKTEMNNESSRSHFLIAIKIMGDKNAYLGTVYILDLAGSEDVKKRMLHFLNSDKQIEKFSPNANTEISKGADGLFTEKDYIKMNLHLMIRPKKEDLNYEQRLKIYETYHETVGLARSIGAIFNLLGNVSKEIPSDFYKDSDKSVDYLMFRNRNGLKNRNAYRVQHIPRIVDINSPTISLSHTGFLNGLDWMLRDEKDFKTRIAVFICLDPRDEKRSMEALNLLPQSTPEVFMAE